jgi:hypothetical protein
MVDRYCTASSAGQSKDTSIAMPALLAGGYLHLLFSSLDVRERCYAGREHEYYIEPFAISRLRELVNKVLPMPPVSIPMPQPPSTTLSSHFRDSLRHGILSEYVSYHCSDLENLLICGAQ